MINKEYNKINNESSFSYIKRMVQYRIDGLFEGTHSQWYEIVFGIKHSEDVARREYYGCKQTIESLTEDDFVNLSENEMLEFINQRQIKLDKQQMKQSDERAYLNRIKREEARYEQAFDFAKDYANIMAESKPFIIKEIKKINGHRKAIIEISDWHYGIEIENFVNKFNSTIAKERVNELYNQISPDIKLFDIDTIYIANLGDLISGLIHTNLRLENREDVMTQIMEVSEIIAELIYKLYFNDKVIIEYYEVIDNHSRVSPNKHEALDGENFTRITKWFLKERFKDIPSIRINDNKLGNDIMTFNVYNHKVCGVHGHNDNATNIVSNLTLMTNEKYDLMLMGHRHSPALHETHKILTIENGSLSGVDTYAKNIRKTSNPSQNLIIVSEDNICDYLKIIKL